MLTTDSTVPVGSQMCRPSMCPPLKKEVSQSLIMEIAAHHTVQAHRATIISRSRTNNNDKDDVDDPCQMTTTMQPSPDNDNNDDNDAARMVSKDR